MNSYLAENPLQSKMKLFLGQDSDEDSKEILRHNLRVLQTYSFPGHVEKYLVVSLKNPELNPGLRIYHSLMIEFLKNNFSVSPTSLEEKLAKKCWACNKIFEDPELLKTCTDCKIAKYCNRDCQRQEWKVHRLLHQELEHTRRLLKEEESEIEKEEKEKEKVKQMLQTR
ncbi:dauer abnormal formation protein 25 [Eurytemora carolleeae]|uniref:dauer abnormal formation protein 25 n=1 Tax=Eurytemora carolleeae TaxID=1294199 RepID=UPI000C771CE7|nr:dauer abnormal formation protein 25 [Eurytemora carolleeae]|eukprot:XP_023339071.1 dauer abnormal formation protein 25-like [Eurytemora affinis]